MRFGELVDEIRRAVHEALALLREIRDLLRERQS